MFMALSLDESKSAPLACGGCMLIPPVDLYVLHGMSESQLVHSGAPGGVSVDLYHWEGIDEFLCIRAVGLH